MEENCHISGLFLRPKLLPLRPIWKNLMRERWREEEEKRERTEGKEEDWGVFLMYNERNKIILLTNAVRLVSFCKARLFFLRFLILHSFFHLSYAKISFLLFFLHYFFLIPNFCYFVSFFFVTSFPDQV